MARSGNNPSRIMAPLAAERIVDANLNRLAEGLRVIEDICRLGLDDPALAKELKKARHEARALRAGFPISPIGARDSAGDVGRERVVESQTRGDLSEILGAAFGRSRESLRVIEEFAKLRAQSVAAPAKALRYRVYELERAIVPLFDRRAKLARLDGLYLILSRPRIGYEALAGIAVKKKVGAIQLRAKELDGGALLALARKIREITRGSGTFFFVNDRADIARLCDADGLHVGQRDLRVADARAICGDGMIVGKSTHNAAELRAALAEGPDYVGIGPVFGTQSKDNPDPALGIDRARRLLAQAAKSRTPAVAIGGINAANLAGLRAAGFANYALIADVNRSGDPAAAIARLQKTERRGCDS